MASQDKFPIVGIGASAGGLEALEGLFRAVPVDTGMSFVIVTHLARGHVSAFGEILGRHTAMPVKTAVDGAVLQPNEVHVCPPDHIMTMIDGKLHLQLRADEAQRKPIDVFLSSLAEAHAEAAVGILLSGGGSDGTLGIKAIKERGGLTLAQGGDGNGPLQTGMPNTAIAAGVIDLVLPLEQMASRLAEYARNFAKIESLIEEHRTETEVAVKRDAYQPIYRLLQNRVGHDFSGYKEKSFQRRVRHRMQVLQIVSLKEYIARLGDDPDEVTLLFRDLLIGVTNFFRDPGAFETLEKTIIPAIFEGRGASETVRIWVPGCATGEEVYSIAILVREHLDTLRVTPKVQLFATDIDEHALVIARTGRYPGPLLENVSKLRLKRYFVGDDVSFSVTKEIRDMCIFSAHSVIRDPPFSRIDMISCRNLLIYFGTEFQAQVIPVFHFALRPRGYLFLGTAENVSQFSDLFAPVEKKQRIFQRRDHMISPLQLTAFTPSGRCSQAPSAVEMRRSPGAMASNLRQAVEVRVLERFSPAHVVVNREGDILHYSPRTGKYLEPAPGLPNRQLIAMARRGLRLDLRNVLREAMQTLRPANREGISVEIDDRVQLVNLVVEPLGDHDHDPLFLVLFQDVGPPGSTADLPQPHEVREGSNQQIEQELRDTRERLQAIIEEYESTVEELKSSNEELQSMNEELQSTNEELETSKEELQSVNEELQTVNLELNVKVDELDRANGDLRNVFESTQIATIFLDQHLVVRSFTPAATEIFNLISGDCGRPLTDIVSHLAETGDLKRDVRYVLEHGDTIERRVHRSDGAAHYLMRLLPYRGLHNRIEGVLVTFVNVTNIVAAEVHQRTLVEELNHRVRNMLTVVGAIANQTLARTGSSGHFAEAFFGRLESMGKSYALVSRENWGEVSLNDILINELEKFAEEEDGRVKIGGPQIAFAPPQALALGLVFHELTTNAAKYGALAKAEGRVAVTWGVEKRRLNITWLERDGHSVGKPAGKGFGTELIERELKSALGAHVTLDYAPKGVEVQIWIPFDSKHMTGLGGDRDG